MKKQITAIVLCTVLLLTTFAACGKKYLVITDEEGYTHYAVTNENGNTVINSDGNIAVFNTDKNGDAVTNNDGSLYTEGVTFPAAVVNGNYFETADFRWEFSDEWNLAPNQITKKDSSLRVTLYTEQDMNYDDLMEKVRKGVEILGDEGREAMQVTETPVEVPGIVQASKISVTAEAEDGSGTYHQTYYFSIRNTAYTIQVVCDLAEKETANFDGMFMFFVLK